MRTTTTSRLTLLAACAAALACSAAFAQPGGRDQARRSGQPTPAAAQEQPSLAPAINAEILTERLDRRLAEIQKEEAAITRAKAELGRGAPVGEVMRSLMRDRVFAMGERMREGPGAHAHDEPAQNLEYDAQRLREMMRFLRDTAPQIAERVEAEILDNPDRAEQVYRRMAPRLLPQMEMRERDPEMFSLRTDSMRLDWQIRQAAQRVQRLSGAASPPAEEVARANTALRDLVEQRVDIANRERALMVDRLEQRVASMRAELKESADERDAEIDQKVRELLADERERRPGPAQRGGGGPRRE